MVIYYLENIPCLKKQKKTVTPVSRPTRDVHFIDEPINRVGLPKKDHMTSTKDHKKRTQGLKPYTL
jgi:hypothetical protein